MRHLVVQRGRRKDYRPIVVGSSGSRALAFNYFGANGAFYPNYQWSGREASLDVKYWIGYTSFTADIVASTDTLSNCAFGSDVPQVGDAIFADTVGLSFPANLFGGNWEPPGATVTITAVDVGARTLTFAPAFGLPQTRAGMALRAEGQTHTYPASVSGPWQFHKNILPTIVINQVASGISDGLPRTGKIQLIDSASVVLSELSVSYKSPSFNSLTFVSYACDEAPVTFNGVNFHFEGGDGTHDSLAFTLVVAPLHPLIKVVDIGIT